jgi:hypothetical protein
MAEDDRDRGAWIGELLDAAADAYEPDGERLRELVAERVARDADGRRPARRPGRRGVGRGLRSLLDRTASTGAAIAAVAAAVAIAVGVTAALAVTSSSSATGASGGGPRRTSAAVVPPDPAADPGRASASASASRPAHTTGSAATPDAYTVSARIDQSSTANPVWTQLDVSVVASKPISAALDITIRVAGCPGFIQPASFTTAPSGSFAKSIVPGTDGTTEFVFHLDAGKYAGTMEFAAQFGHAATGWNPAQDGYRVTGAGGATTASGSY